jgi:UDP-glucose 4-epimerase
MDTLVCGGAGYIGGFLAKMLAEQGHRVVVFDTLNIGFQSHDAHKKIKFVEGNLLNEKDLYVLFKRHHFDAVFHMATFSLSGIEKNNISQCYRNNITGTMNLLGQMRTSNVDKIVFASTGLVYGSQTMVELDETAPTVFETAFITTIITIENMLKDFYTANGLNSISLRFNNASGMADQYHSYRWHDANPPELVKLLKAFQTADAPAFEVPGDNHPTHDGSSIRDYIHVLDVCDAFIKAMLYLEQGQQGTQKINLGSKGGSSYKQLVEIAQQVSGNTQGNIRVEASTAPAVQTLSSVKAQKLLGWEPQYTVEAIMQSLWQAMTELQAEAIADKAEQLPEPEVSDSVVEDSNNGLADKLKFWNRLEVGAKVTK